MELRTITMHEVDELRPKGIEVIGFSMEWVDLDFNPNGTRACFFTDEGTCISAKWVDYQDTYVTDETTMPTHYFTIPDTKNMQKLIKHEKH